MNEPAFPYVCDADFDYGTGMTLRDYFAAKIVQAFESRKDLDDVPMIDIAKRSYKIADAMLKARQA